MSQQYTTSHCAVSVQQSYNSMRLNETNRAPGADYRNATLALSWAVNSNNSSYARGFAERSCSRAVGALLGFAYGPVAHGNLRRLRERAACEQELSPENERARTPASPIVSSHGGFCTLASAFVASFATVCQRDSLDL